jgi:hypothetical protein
MILSQSEPIIGPGIHINFRLEQQQNLPRNIPTKINSIGQVVL